MIREGDNWRATAYLPTSNVATVAPTKRAAINQLIMKLQARGLTGRLRKATNHSDPVTTARENPTAKRTKKRTANSRKRYLDESGFVVTINLDEY